MCHVVLLVQAGQDFDAEIVRMLKAVANFGPTNSVAHREGAPSFPDNSTFYSVSESSLYNLRTLVLVITEASSYEAASLTLQQFKNELLRASSSGSMKRRRMPDMSPYFLLLQFHSPTVLRPGSSFTRVVK